MKKSISLILALVLIFSMLPMSVFAAEPVKVTLTADKTTVAAGEEIILTMSIDQPIEDAYIWQWNIMWNGDLFEAVSMAKGDSYKGAATNINATIPLPAPYKASSVTSGNSLRLHTLAAGTLCTLTLKAKTDISADTGAKFFLNCDTIETGYEDDDLNVIKAPYTNVTTDYNWGSNYNALPAEGSSSLSVPVTTTPVTPPTPDDPERTETDYTVTMGEDKSIVAGESVTIPVTIGSGGKAETYNAFDMSFTYDAAVLELISTEIEGLTVTTGEGTVRVKGYGEDRNVGTAPFSLTFKGTTTGTANVTVTSAKVDLAANAVEFDAPEATLSDSATAVTVTGYPVTLPENFTGEPVAQPGQEYTFSKPTDYYDYTVKVEVGGEEVNVTESNGSYTIPADKVNGAIVITAEKTGKLFNVTLGTDMAHTSGTIDVEENGQTVKKVQYMTPYTATLTAEEGYSYDVSVTIAGEAYTDYTVSEGVYSIPGADITGDIVFTVTKTAIPATEYSVKFEGDGAGDAKGEKTAVAGEDYFFTLDKAEGYTYNVSYKMGDGEATELGEADGKYTIKEVSGDLVITITKTSTSGEVAVYTYVELDSKTMFLVTVDGTAEEGKAYAYDGNAMFYSEVYEAWCYLVIVEEGTAFNADIAKEKVALTETSFTTVKATSDVNMSDTTDINDAQLVYDMYNGKYEDFSTVARQKFLNADQNNSKSVDTRDAAAVVAAIQ